MTITPMSITVRKDFFLKLYGFSGIAVGDNWAATGKQLMDRLWNELRSRQLPNKGVNVWVYEAGSSLFTGVELVEPPPAQCLLEEKIVSLPRYAHYKHIGPYDAIRSSHGTARQELKKIGFQPALPYVEIYGHHQDDPAKQETELIWSIK